VRSGDSIVGPGADRQAAPRPVPGRSSTTQQDGLRTLGPFRFGPGYSPWKDPTVLLLLAISLVAAVMFVGGATIGPALAGDDDGGGVFPVIDILTGGDGGGNGTALALEANRSELDIGDTVAFTVTDANETPVGNATVAVAGARHSVDDSGRAIVRIDRAGDLTATASAPGSNDSTRESNQVSLSVAPRSVQLRVQANRSAATAGEPIALTLVRDDTGTAVRGSIYTRFVPAEEFHIAGEVTRHDGSQFVTVPDRAGHLLVLATRESGGGETYRRYLGTVAVERRTVGLDLTIDPAEVVAGGTATATVRRVDTGERVTATLDVGDRTIETNEDGRAQLSFEAAGSKTVRATAASTPAVRFAPDEASVEVRRRDVPLAVSVTPTAITDGGHVTVVVTRADTDEPIAGTVTVAGSTTETAPNGTATVSIATPGEVSVRADAPDSPAETFLPATDTVSVSNATFDLALVDAPASVTPGESFSTTVRVTNRGPANGTDTLRFRIDGELVDRRAVSLAAGNETTIGFEATAPSTAGEAVLSVQGSDATLEESIAVEEE